MTTVSETTNTRPVRRRQAAVLAIVRFGAIAIALVAAGCGTAPHVGSLPTISDAPVPGTIIMIIRHGEKPVGPIPGIDPSGRPDPGSLTLTGWDRARRLIKVFAPPTTTPRPGLARPKAIYAAGANESGEGARTRETVAPLAQRLGITVNTTYGKGEEDALATDVASQPGPTLICWQHGEIPALARAFPLVTPYPPSTWPDDRFDVIWTLTATEYGWRFAQFPELALPDDLNMGIAS